MSKAAQGRSRLAGLAQPGPALIAASILLPAVLFAFAAWFSYRETFREAEGRVERTARILEEHALEVFETHRLVIQQVNTRLRFMDWTREADRADLHKMLGKLQDDLDQVSTLTISDAEGRMIASGRTYPANPAITFVDRDYFQALKRADTPLPYVSSAYRGRQSGQLIFNLAGRIAPSSGGAFAGVIAVSADRGYFQGFYRSVDPDFDHSVLLVREDGSILVSEPEVDVVKLPFDFVLLRRMQQAPAGSYTLRSRLDGVERIFAYRKIGPYPVYVRFGIATAAALAPWRASLANYGIVAALASLALVVASSLAVKQTRRERVARRRWQETAAALQAEAVERGKVEQQLRQAQKMEAVGRLTGGVAHDFNNLLTAVIGSLDLVRRRPGTMDARNLQFIGNALEGAQRAAALTSRLLAFSRQQPLEPSLVDVDALVAGMSDLLCRTLGEAVAIETVLAGDDLWPTLVDPNQLEIAILNLAVNARDAMAGGGHLTIETGAARLDEAYARANTDVAAGDYVLVAVSDTGTGMAPEIIAQVFEPFFTTKPVGQGTGLGLSQVYGFVKQSGGHVAIYSEVGHGSTFKLYLPRAQRVAAGQPRLAVVADAATAPTPRAQGETILVVEDEAMVRQLSVSALEEAGYKVLAAGDGAQGLELSRRHDGVALLFTDVVLVGSMNGKTLADTILKERPGLPVLFTTGYSRNAIVHSGRLDEGVNLIGKPFTSESLVARVHQLLRERRAS